MPRKLKATWNVSEQFLERLTDVGRDFIPHDPVLVRMTVGALMLRVEERSPKEAHFLRHSLVLLAFMEREFPNLSTTDLKNNPTLMSLTQKVLATTLHSLVYGKPGRHEHYIPFLRLQRLLLVQYIDRHPYPSQAVRCEGWVHEHAEPIWDLLSQLKCLCQYSKSLRDISLDDLNWSRTPGRVICLLLAKLHRATPAQIQKLLSHSPRSSR